MRSNINALSLYIREASSLPVFRRGLNSNIIKPPKYLSFGKRFLDIIHTKLRHRCILKSDLHRCNIVKDPILMCSCGYLEDAYLIFSCVKNHKTKRHHSVKTERRHSATFQSPFSRLNGRYISVIFQ